MVIKFIVIFDTGNTKASYVKETYGLKTKILFKHSILSHEYSQFYGIYGSV